jgi:hypothetical protein
MQKMLMKTSRRVTEAATGLERHFLRMSEGPFSHDVGHLLFYD